MSKTFNWLLACLCIASVTLCGCASDKSAIKKVKSSSNSIIKNPQDKRNYKYFTLKNNMRVLLISDKETETASVALNVSVGAKHDPVDMSGLAHYLEHMVMRGVNKDTGKPNEFKDFLSVNAGRSNATTSATRTTYFFNVEQSALTPALNLFGNMFISPVLDSKYSEKELSAIENEWSSKKESRKVDEWQVLLRSINPAHPMSDMFSGNKAVLQQKGMAHLHKELTNFYERYYSANLMNLVIYAKDDIDTLQQIVEQNFSEIVDRQVEVPETKVIALSEEHVNKHIRYKSADDEHKFYLEFPMVDNGEDRTYKPNNYVYLLMTSKDPNTLTDYLQNKGWIYTLGFNASSNLFGADGRMAIHFTLTDEGVNHKDEIIGAVLAYVRLIEEQGLKESYYQELKLILDKGYNNARGSIKKVITLSQALHEYPIKHVLNHRYILKGFRPEMIRSVLSQMSLDKIRLWHISADEKTSMQVPHYDAKYAISDISSSDLQKWQTLSANIKLSLPVANTLLSKKSASRVRTGLKTPTKVVDKPGVEAWLANSTHFKTSHGILESTLSANLEMNAKALFEGLIINRLYREQQQAVLDKASKAGLKVKLSIKNGNTMEIDVQGDTKQQLNINKDLLAGFVALDINQQKFELAKTKVAQFLQKQASKQGISQAMTAQARAMVNRSSFQQQIDEGNNITLKSVKQRHAAILANNHIKIYAFGNYAPQNIEELTKVIELALPASRKVGSAYTIPTVNFSPIDLNLHSGKNENTRLDVRILAEPSLDDVNNLLIYSRLYGGAFSTALRTEAELGYRVSAFGRAHHDYPVFMRSVQSNSHSIERIDEAINKFDLQFNKKLKNIPGKIIQKLKHSILKKIMQKPKSLRAESNAFYADYARGNYKFDSKIKSIAALELVDKESVLKLAERLNDPSQYVTQKVGVTGNP